MATETSSGKNEYYIQKLTSYQRWNGNKSFLFTPWKATQI